MSTLNNLNVEVAGLQSLQYLFDMEILWSKSLSIWPLQLTSLLGSTRKQEMAQWELQADQDATEWDANFIDNSTQTC